MLKEIFSRAEKKRRRFDESFFATAEYNTAKVLAAFRKHKVALDMHLGTSSGYGYDDVGRDTLEKIYAEVFGGEDALVRQQIVSGTHAISLCLFGVLLPGDTLLAIGDPYDTMQTVIGKEETDPGTLRELGVKYQVAPVDFSHLQEKTIKAAAGSKPKMVLIQRSKGYEWRKTLSVEEIGKITNWIKEESPETIVFVDNCYGEFVEKEEPLEVGADIIAGSLIKNPGAGLAPGGGYVIGKKDLVARIAARLTAPGVGKEIGASFSSNRLFYQGLFLAPHTVQEALNGAVFAAAVFEALDLETMPAADDLQRTDIIQGVKFADPNLQIVFCQKIQKYSPVDSHVTPMPWGMPGYDDQVVMAAGAFVQGSSIELSADGPIRPPYVVYLQGGLTKNHVILAVKNVIEEMIEEKLIKIS